MAAPRYDEVATALAGTLRLACGEPGALAVFDRSREGFWRSFHAALLAYPCYLVLVTMRVSVAQWDRVGGGRILLVETIAYVIVWTLFPLVMVEVARWLGREERYFDFMVPYNWCQLPQSLLSVVIGLAAQSRFLAPVAVQSIAVLAGLTIFLYEWMIARTALGTTRSIALLVVAIDFALAIAVSSIAASLY